MIVPMGWICLVLDLVVGPVALVLMVLLLGSDAPLEVCAGLVVDGIPGRDWTPSNS